MLVTDIKCVGVGTWGISVSVNFWSWPLVEHPPGGQGSGRWNVGGASWRWITAERGLIWESLVQRWWLKVWICIKGVQNILLGHEYYFELKAFEIAYYSFFKIIFFLNSSLFPKAKSPPNNSIVINPLPGSFKTREDWLIVIITKLSYLLSLLLRASYYSWKSFPIMPLLPSLPYQEVICFPLSILLSFSFP